MKHREFPDSKPLRVWLGIVGDLLLKHIQRQIQTQSPQPSPAPGPGGQHQPARSERGVVRSDFDLALGHCDVRDGRAGQDYGAVSPRAGHMCGVALVRIGKPGGGEIECGYIISQPKLRQSFRALCIIQLFDRQSQLTHCVADLHEDGLMLRAELDELYAAGAHENPRAGVLLQL